MPHSTPADQLVSRQDLDFLLHDWLGLDEILATPRFAEHSRDTVEAALDLSASMAAAELAPLHRLTDQTLLGLSGGTIPHPPEVKKAIAAILRAGIPLGPVAAEHGGMQLPLLAATACNVWFQAANPSVWAYPLLAVANANTIVAHGSPEQVEEYAAPLYEGRYMGTMCLSEPDVGSSLADITTRAIPQPDGTYRLFGNKMWISAAEHDLSENIVHLVLAKVPGGPVGTKGISMFIVPKFLTDGSGERNDATVIGVNHKMGYRGIVNTALNFGDGTTTPRGEAGAIGYLVGEENRGMTFMFHMMNEARISVGSVAAAMGYTAYLRSLAYARTRLQGRPPSAKNTESGAVALVEHADIRRMLMAQKSYAEGALGLVLYSAKLVDEAETSTDPEVAAAARRLLEVLTPITKSWPSQWCLHGNELAMQVLGGAGYTEEHDLELIYRDNRLNPIHEGTHGIQGIDLLGRKTTMHDGAAFAELVRRMRATVDEAIASGAGLADLARTLSGYIARVEEVTATLHRCDDVDLRLANASLYLEAVGHVVVAWIWLQQALAAKGIDSDFHEGKRRTARYFFTYELPFADQRFDLLEAVDDQTMTMPIGAF